MKMLVAFSFQIVKKDNFWSANAAGWGDIEDVLMEHLLQSTLTVVTSKTFS
jgi:hypothetical protein